MATTKTHEDYALNGYCLWLVPDRPAASALGDVVSTLAAKEGSPEFMPHITLLSPKNKFKESSTALQGALEDALSTLPRGPMELVLESPAPGTFYYQCVLAPVQPTTRLLELRAAVEKACDDHPPKYFPHLSLVYGDLTDERKKEVCSDAAKLHTFPQTVTFKEAVVVDVNGTAPGWKVVARVSL